ncbi:hypothetical protein HDU76_006614 [Blyttiomyces sp. JEL0837]|nr:hypothetical protein HDU76_006614 [Blyttiomyces sp. JEL0837]
MSCSSGSRDCLKEIDTSNSGIKGLLIDDVLSNRKYDDQSNELLKTIVRDVDETIYVGNGHPREDEDKLRLLEMDVIPNTSDPGRINLTSYFNKANPTFTQTKNPSAPVPFHSIQKPNVTLTLIQIQLRAQLHQNRGLLILSPVNTVPLTSLTDRYQIRQLAPVNIRIKYIPRVTPYLVVYTCLSVGMLSGIVILVMLIGFDYVPYGGGVCCGGSRKRAAKDSRKGSRIMGRSVVGRTSSSSITITSRRFISHSADATASTHSLFIQVKSKSTLPRTILTQSQLRNYSSGDPFSAIRSNPKAYAIFQAIQKDPVLLQSVLTLAKLLQSKGYIDPSKPKPGVGPMETIKMMMDSDIRKAMMDVASKLKNAGVELDEDGSGKGSGNGAGGSTAGMDVMRALFGGGSVAGPVPPPPPSSTSSWGKSASNKDVVVEGSVKEGGDEKSSSSASKASHMLKGFFRK